MSGLKQLSLGDDPASRRKRLSERSDIIPALNDNLSKAIRVHFAVDNFSKDALPPLHAHRHEIRAGPRVIVISQPDRATVMFAWVMCHGMSGDLIHLGQEA